MDDLRAKLEKAEAEAASLRRQISQGPCRQYGHAWKMIGGTNAGCGDECVCSVPVHTCEKCGDCDYGDNVERDEIVMECAERHGRT